MPDYYSTFLSISADIDWDDQALKDAFESGLSREIRIALANREHQPKTLRDLAKAAISLYVHLDGVKVASNGNNGSGGGYQQNKDNTKNNLNINKGNSDNTFQKFKSGQQNKTNDNKERKSQNPKAKSDNERKSLTFKEKKHRRDNGLCLYCGSPDHMVINCPEAKKRPTPATGANRIGLNSLTIEGPNNGQDKDCHGRRTTSS
ncbi:hypothetical protein M231_07513 [Tremella mesenterica]|uniref:CCHC-type domain-containing protein n=1 Tax=Tremella mesenterica TaxID=5217 RepID=A0A4Q1BE23_TREME|nr:uncharacterized protein TREMEDRAFT_65299 [Tremella mesenterica DSM 1558]EIW66446.1 hypothetical protein TREMEDRAFT_65299 [Tremella mesenterica DSM 1558]RXK35235.1 hypothetical protein M231_07513 [Tremella mesenterica]